MIAYKGFNPGLICKNYQFEMGINRTKEANCRANGFHCAANPLDCLSYYPDIHSSEYYIVDAGGDIDEDGDDSKISCTELNIRSSGCHGGKNCGGLRRSHLRYS